MSIPQWWCLAVAALAWTCTEASWSSMFTDFIPTTPPATKQNNTLTTHEGQYYDAVVEQLLSNVMEAHGLHDKRREKRSTDDFSIKDTFGAHRLQFLIPVVTLCEQQIFSSLLQYDNKLFAVCISVATRHAPPTLTVGFLEGNLWKPLASTKCVDPIMAIAFVFNNKLYIVTADAGLENGAELMFFDKDTRKIYIDHTIHSVRPTALAFWKMQSTGEYNMALANSGKEVSTSVYSWKATYFDKYATLESKVVRDLEPFAIHSADFLVVVNQRFSEDAAKVSTIIYKYDLSQNAWKTFQQIPTFAAMDAEFFSMGRHPNSKDFFLAIANHYEQVDRQRNYAVDSIVYKYVEGKFVPFQCLHTTGATKIAAYEGQAGEFLLAVASLYEPVHLYQYNGWRFVLANVQYTRATMSPGVRHVHFYRGPYSKEVLMGVSNPSAEGPGLYKVTFYHDDQIERWYEDSLKWCHDSRALSTEDTAASLVSQLDGVFYTDRTESIHLVGEVVFQDLQVAHSIRAPEFQELATGERYSMKNLRDLENLEIELLQMKDTIERLISDLENALKLTGDQLLTGDYHLDNLQLDCADCHLETTYMNKEDVTNLRGRLFFTDAPTSVNVPMSFQYLTAPKLAVDGTVNGMNTSKLVTLSENHVLTGNLRFATPVFTKDVSLSGLLGGHTFSSQHFMLTQGDQTVTAGYAIPDTSVHALQVRGLCNGIDFNKFYATALTTNGNHFVSGHKTFQQIAVNGILHMDKGGLLNGADLVDLWKNVMWTHGDQISLAIHNYSNARFIEMKVDGTVNGLQLPGPDTVLIHQNVNIPAEKVFLRDTYIKELHVNWAINGIRRLKDTASDWRGQLDILVKTPSQIIPGRKTFKSIVLNQHSAVGRFVDGVDLSELAALMRTRRTPVMNGTWTFEGNVVFKDRVLLGGFVNGRRLDDLYGRALRLDAPVFPNRERVVFTKNLLAKDVHCRDVNGFHVPSSFVLRHGPKVMSGEKGFHHLGFTGDVKVKGLVNGVDLGVINDTLFSRGNQVVKVPKIFKQNVHIKHLIVRKSINGVSIAEFCRLNEVCVFTAPKDFESITVKGGVAAHNLIARATLNGICVSELFRDTMLYSAPQTIRGHKIFANLTIPRMTNIQTSNFSGFKLAQLYADAVLLNADQTITSKKIFKAPVMTRNFQFHSQLDGISPEDLRDWMLQGIDQTVLADLIFQGDLETLGDLKVQDTINEVDLKALVSRIAFKNEQTTFTGPVHFGFVASMGDVNVTGTVQGIDVSEEVVDKTRDVVVTGRKYLKSGFDVGGDMWVDGFLDSVKVEDLCAKAVTTGGRKIVTAPTTIVGDVTFHDGAQLGGYLAGVNVKELQYSCLKLSGGVATGPKYFKELVVEGPLSLRGSLNGRNLDYMKQNLMSLTHDQVVSAKLKMLNMDVRGPLRTRGFDTASVNGVNLPRFVKSVLRTMGNQVVVAPCQFVNVSFGDVTVRGSVNGVRLPDDILTKSRVNVVAGPLEIIGDATVTEALTMPESALLQGVDVLSWARDAVLNDGREYFIRGRKTFNNLHVAGAQVHGQVDGVTVSPQELLLTTGNQIITGRKIFKHDLVVNEIRTSGPVNGINIQDFVNSAMLKSRPNTVTAPKIFFGGFKVLSLRTMGRIGNVSVDRLRLTPRSVGALQPLKQQLHIHGERIAQFDRAFKDQAILVSYYYNVFAFTVGASRSMTYAQLVSSPEDLILISLGGNNDACSTMKVFMMPRNQVRLAHVHLDIPIAQGSSIHHLSLPSTDFIVVVNKNSAKACSGFKPTNRVLGDGDGSLEIFRWNPQQKRAELYQVIKLAALRSVSVFRQDASSCVAAIADDSLKIICIRNPSEGFRLVQNLQIHYSTDVSAYRCPTDSSVLVAVSASQLGQYDKLFIYHWSNSGLKKLASIPFVSVSSIATVGHGGNCFVIVGQNQVGGSQLPVSVYRYVHNEPQKIFETQKLMAGDVKGMSWIKSPDGKSPLLFVHLEGGEKNLKVFSFKGASGFVQVDALQFHGNFHDVRVFRRSDGHHLITMSGNEDEPSAVVLISKLKGKPSN
ncbi:uncharacterized protein LOC135395065 [Ornithodoros turicata]|uniref:uncharacterized protein LOC135395065 n=1 Tax=Ornithodoros turicata TaxID=34597 RepID=UPI003139C76D